MPDSRHTDTPRDAVADEQLNSGAVALSDVFGLEAEDFEDAGDFDLRTRVDQGEATFEDVAAAFEPINTILDAMVSDQLDRILATATNSRLPGEILQRLYALQASLDAFSQIGEITIHGTEVLIGSAFLPELLTSEAVTHLVEATSRFDAAVQSALAFEELPAADAWRVFLGDPAAQRTQEGYDTAVALGLGTMEEAAIDPDTLTSAFADAGRWSELANQALQTASADLRDAARSQVSDETASMGWRLGGTAVLTVVALAVAIRIARSVTRPMERIATAAGQVQEGQLDLDPIEPGGPREVASTADAFNDMAATLTEVERRAIALAEEPDDPSLATPLPGRVGRALQEALDRLRLSIRLAEERRAELQRVATHDGLTELLNRTAALDALARELAQSRRDGARTFALFIDLDELKPINDSHGHDAGDDAIRCSVGIAATNSGADDESVDELVQRADTALYQAKRSGGSRTSWGPTVSNGTDRE